MLISDIHSPNDIKNLSRKELLLLASDIRNVIIETVSKNGGHLASNLGTVELALALHRSFNSPEDAIVWDVGHQCYTHKLITGRGDVFSTLRQHGGLSGFTKRCESPHDFFDVGHSSTSISSALGLLTARRLTGGKGKVVAVIGDGALTGGMAFEALSHAGLLSQDLIVVLNDNQMSISQNTGAFSRHLTRLTMTPSYQSFRFTVDRIVSRLPFASGPLTRFIFRFKRGLKGLFLQNNLFSELGFEYVGPLNGHNISELELTFKQVKKLKRPVVVHVVTRKGYGYAPAENDPEVFHGVGSFRVSDGTVEKTDALSYTGAFADAVVKLGEKRLEAAAITAAMTKGTGLTDFSRRFPERFFDVGIAEQHAVTFAGGLAAAGMLPVTVIYSTFMQRAVDQLIHDIAIPAWPSVFMLDRSGAVPDDGETHQGIFDIALFRPIPNLIIMAPASAGELERFLFWAADRKMPVIIRYPKASCPAELPSFGQPVAEGRGVLLSAEELISPGPFGTADEKNRILFVCTGGIFPEVLEACRKLASKGGYADIYNIRFIKPVDEEWFIQTISPYKAVITVEDGVAAGGVGEYLYAVCRDKLPEKRICSMGFPQRFIPHGKRSDILKTCGLSPDDMVRRALSML